MLLSIDFGTCNSSAAVIINNTLKPIKEPLKHGYSFPSSVYLTEQGDFLVGQAAENNRLRDIRRYRTKFKKELGSASLCRLGDRSFSPHELVSEVLRKLKTEAEKTVPEVITNVVITIPATYQKFKRDLMQQAAQAAGFSQVSLLEEPVAAAIYYTRQYRNLLKDGDVILVYDLGGGTFDASLIKKQGDWFQILGSPMGLENCGGTDFDREIYQNFKQQCSSTLREKLEQENAWRPRAIIAEQCINLKHQLSEDIEATIDISLGFDELESYHLTRDNFHQMIAPFIRKTTEICDQIIQSAGLDWNNLHSVLMVGGSCRIPYVQEALRQKLGHSPLLVDEPELAVCQGAAIYILILVEQLKTLMEGILHTINLTLRNLNAVQEEEKILSQLTAEMNANKNYTYSLEVPDIQKINLPTGVYTLTCLICNFSCQDNCTYTDDEKFRATVMRGDQRNAICTVCPNKCSWREHKSAPYKIVYSTKIETRTYDDLLKRYNTAHNDKDAREKSIQKLNDKLRELCEELYQMIQQAQEYIRRLEEIDLKYSTDIEKYKENIKRAKDIIIKANKKYR